MKHLITICLLVMSLTSTAQTYSKELKKSAQNGDVIAQRDMGICLYYGNDIKQDKKEAYFWFLKAALGGDNTALYQLGVFHEFDKVIIDGKLRKKIASHIVSSDSPFANRLIKVYGIKKEWSTKGSWQFVKFCISDDDREIASGLFLEAAQKNNTKAQLKLAYQNHQNNLSVALNWFEKAAELGNAEAQYQTGICYLKGRGVAKDITKARFWLEKATAQNYSQAQNTLSELAEEERRDSIEQVRRQEAERIRLEEERRTQSLLAKGTMMLPFNQLQEVKDYHFFGDFVNYEVSRSQKRLLSSLCKNDVLSYAGMQNADNLDRAAYLQSSQYQLDKQQLENSRDDIFVYATLLSNMKLISSTNPIYEADGFKLQLYPEPIKDFKGNYLYINGFVVPTKSCTVGGFHYFKSNNIAALQKIKQSERNVNAVFVLLCKPGFNVDNTAINVVRPTALYITDRSTNEILMDLSQYLRTIDTQAEKQQIISQVKNDLSKVEQYKKKHNPDKKFERKYHKDPFRYQCGSCGGLGYVEQFKGGVLTKVRCTTCYGHGYLETHYY